MTGIRTLLIFLFISFGLLEANSWNTKKDDFDNDIPNRVNLIRSTRQTTLEGLEKTQGLDQETSGSSSSVKAGTKTKFYELELPSNYNMHEIPKHKSGRPMEVLIQMNMRKVIRLDEDDERIQVDMELRVFWTDYHIRDHVNNKREEQGLKRISFSDLTPALRKNMTKTLNDPGILDSIWKPNLFFEGLIQVAQPYAMARPIILKLIPEIGAFEYLSRITVLTDCPMDFHYYPTDTQTCPFEIRSFAYRRQDLVLSWYRTGVWLHTLEVSSFDVHVSDLNARGQDGYDYDIYSFLIKARRRLSYHMVQTYLPSTFYIIITCLCFLLPSRYVEARIGIAMTTLLTLTAMFASVRSSTPVVSYVKAIDVWMAGSIMFVFLVLAEFTFITWLGSVKEDYEEARKKKTDDPGTEMEMNDLLKDKKTTSITFANPNTINYYERLMKFLEKYNFPIFIGILIFSTIIYWTWLLNSADYFDWKTDASNNNLGLPGQPGWY